MTTPLLGGGSSGGSMQPPPTLGRDSILKQQGSVKADKRVSIQQAAGTNNNNNSTLKLTPNVEYVSERQQPEVQGSVKRLTTKPPPGEV